MFILKVKSASKVINILIGDIIKPASEEAFKELSKEGKLNLRNYSENVLMSIFSSKVSEYVAKLPADSKRLLQSTNDKLREITGSMISKEIGAAVNVGKELGD